MKALINSRNLILEKSRIDPLPICFNAHKTMAPNWGWQWDRNHFLFITFTSSLNFNPLFKCLFVSEHKTTFAFGAIYELCSLKQAKTKQVQVSLIIYTWEGFLQASGNFLKFNKDQLRKMQLGKNRKFPH